ncbi:MAG: CpaF family protein [Planctomycetota bacterium]|nr:CpaF family protein [Planctomycetota bacterium]
MSQEDERSAAQPLRERLRRSLAQTGSRRLAQRVVGRETPARRAERPESPSPSGYHEIKSALFTRLLEELGEQTAGSEEQIRETVRAFVDRVLDEGVALNERERTRLSEDLTDEVVGLGPLAPLMADPAVTDILVNGPTQVYIERFGSLEPTDVRFRDDDHIRRVIERIAARVGRRIDLASPLLDARLPDGSRVNATLPPISIDGPTLSIRRFGHRRLTQDDLLSLREFSPEMLVYLDLAVRLKKNVLISGGTGAGKSTLLGALAESIPASERVVTIEDAAELILDQPHVVRLETRPANIEGQGVVRQRELVINSLRMRPDRIIVGEVRGGEALDMLQAMNTGHEGSLSTIHANGPRDALSRLETMVLMSGLELPSRAIREQVVGAIQVLVHVRRYEDGVRRVASVSEIVGLEGDAILTNDIFVFKRSAGSGRRVGGDFQATGVVPRLADDLRERGEPVPVEIFRAPPGAPGRA